MGHAFSLSASIPLAHRMGEGSRVRAKGSRQRPGAKCRMCQHADRRIGFVVANSTRIAHSCSMKISEDIHEYAAELGIAEEEARKRGLEAKSKEFMENGAEVYAKV